jgi:hypothetical protein
LEAASWDINAAGMRVFSTAINMCETKEDSMKLTDDDKIEERYTGHKTASYIGKYRTNGKKLQLLLVCCIFLLQTYHSL